MRGSFIAKIALGIVCCIGCLGYIGCNKVAPPSLGGRLNVEVLCNNCGTPQEPQVPHLLILDQDTGEIWSYRLAEVYLPQYGRAVPTGVPLLNKKPVLFGNLSKLGEPVTRASAAGEGESSVDSAAKRAAYQASAVGSLRTLNTSEVTYASTYTSGFSPNIASLDGNCSPPTASCAGLIDQALGSGVRNGYRFTYSPRNIGPGGRIDGYTINADPLEPGVSGGNHYYTDESGVIRQNTDRPAGPTDPPLAG
jgi:type IV pilus assembly protein PilA